MSRSRRTNRRGQRPETQASISDAVKQFDAMVEHEFSTIGVVQSYKLSTWVYGAVSAIASAVSQSAFVIHHEGSQDPIRTGPLFDLVEKPNDYPMQNTSAKYRYAYMTELLLAGAVMKVFADMIGMVPTKMIAMPRRDFIVLDQADENGMIVPIRWMKTNRGRAISYIPEDDIFHDALYNPYHDYEGLAPLEAALTGIELDVSVSEFANRFFKNDASTGVIFSSDEKGFGQKQADEAHKKWKETQGGLRRAHSARFVGWGLKPHKFTEPFDARTQHILKSLTRQEIIQGIYRIPIEIFGNASDNSGGGVVIGSNSSEPAKEMMLLNVVIPWARRYDEDFNKDVARRFGPTLRGEHDFENNPILETRKLERAKIAAQLIDRGVPLNEVIRWLGLKIKPQEHGDEFWVENWKVPAKVIMDAGQAVLNLNTHKPNKQSPTDEYIEQIIRLSQTTQVRQLAEDEVLRNGNGHKQAGIVRIAETVQNGH